MPGPILTGFASSLTFDEALVNTTPQLLDSDVVLTAGTSGFGNSTLTIVGLLPEDVISVRNQGTGLGQVGLSGSTITYSGIAIGAISGGSGSTLTITFGGFAGAAAVDAVIQNLTYANLSNSPALNRSLILDITDSGGGRLNGQTAIFTPLGTFTDPPDPIGYQYTYQAAPTAFDMDLDGDLDLIVGERFGSMGFIENNGDGSFTTQLTVGNPFVGWDFGTDATPSFGDLDNDGDLDLVVGVLYGTVQSYVNSGANVFTELVGAANPFNGVESGSKPGFVDLDRDGDTDVVFGRADGTLRFFSSNGASGFTELTGAANPLNGIDVGTSAAPSFVDLNGDGYLDAVVGTGDGYLLSFLNNGAGGFTQLIGAANPFNGVDVGNTAAATFLDVNGDLTIDAVVGADDGTLQTFLGTPPVTLDINVEADSAGPNLAGLTSSVTFDENLVNQTPQLLDAAVVFTDDDGVFANGSFLGGRLAVSGLLADDRVSILNQGVGAGQIGLSGSSVTYGGVEIGTLAGGVGTTLTISFNFAAAQASIDALIQTLTYANVSNAPITSRTLVLDITDAQGLHLNAVPATFAPWSVGFNPFFTLDVGFNSDPTFGDLDNDGDIDMVIGDYWGELRSFVNNGSGVFSELTGAANPFAGVTAGQATPYFSAPSLGDLDGDGDMDLVLGSVTGAVRSFVNNGAGGFTELTGASNPFNGLDVGSESTPELVDLDGDGDSDLVIGAKSGGLLISYANNGLGGFSLLTGASDPFNGVNFGDDIAPGFVDLDGDNDMDLVVGLADGTLRYIENNGAGEFYEQAPIYNPFAGLDVGDAGAASFFDVDGDGDLDAVVGKLDGTLQVFENTTLPGASTVGIVVTVVKQVDTFTGTSGNDSIVGSADKDVLNGLGGDDSLIGSRGDDRLRGANGDDTLNGGYGDDEMTGAAGNDTYLVNSAGDLVFETTSTTSNIDAGGIDTVKSSVSINLDAYVGVHFVENLVLTGAASINAIGNALANRLTGNAGNNVLNGGLGNDILLGGAGNDTYVVNVASDRVFETTTSASLIDAGGIDTVQSAVSFNLDATTGVRFVERLTLTGTANINGTGNALANRLTGNAGNNVLNGGLGNDTLLGGAGNDTFVFNTALSATNVDRINDFNVVEDRIRLDDTVFSGLATGSLSASAFAANLTGAATDALDRITYETDTGRVYFDADGNGVGARIHFATLTANLDLTNADFFVF